MIIARAKTVPKLFLRLVRYLLCLPFWQSGPAVCHFGSSPTVVGVAFCSSPIFGGITPKPYHMVPPLPRVGGSVPLANEAELCRERTPINGGWVALNPLPYPLIRGNRYQKSMIKNLHDFSFYPPIRGRFQSTPLMAGLWSNFDRAKIVQFHSGTIFKVDRSVVLPSVAPPFKNHHHGTLCGFADFFDHALKLPAIVPNDKDIHSGGRQHFHFHFPILRLSFRFHYPIFHIGIVKRKKLDVLDCFQNDSPLGFVPNDCGVYQNCHKIFDHFRSHDFSPFPQGYILYRHCQMEKNSMVKSSPLDFWHDFCLKYSRLFPHVRGVGVIPHVRGVFLFYHDWGVSPPKRGGGINTISTSYIIGQFNSHYL
jgi:hypothetical protein